MISLIQTAKDLLSFIGRTDNPHAVTADQLGTYTTKEIDDLVNGVIVTTKDLPITRFGSLLWLPLNFSGSFEGATRNEINYFAVCHFENDGTPVALINATNGVREAVYYSSFKLDSNGAIVDHIPAATEYRPPFLQPDWWCSAVMQGAARGAIWGYLSGNTDYDGWVSLTNNTLNWANHQGAVCKIPTEITDQSGWVCASGNYVYLFHAAPGTLDLKVWRVSVVDVRTKSAVTWERLTNITTVGVRKTYTGDFIRTASTLFSANESDDPLYIKVGSADQPQAILHIFGDVDPTTGNIGISANRVGSVAWNFGNYSACSSIYVVFNPTTNRAEVPENLRGNTIYRQLDVAPGYRFEGPNAFNNEQIMMGGDQQAHKSVGVSDTNLVLSVQYNNENAGSVRMWKTTKPDMILPAWQFWNYSLRSTRLISNLNLVRQYPTALGDSARCPFWLSPSKLGIVSISNSDTIFNRKYTFPVTPVIGQPTFGFATARLGNITGFKPQPREDVGSAYRLGHIEYWDTNDNLTVGGGRIFTGSLSSYTVVDSNLNYSGSVSITQAQHDALVNQIIAAGDPAWPSASAATVRMEIQIFKDASQVCQGLLVTHDATNNIAYEYFFTVNVSARTGSLASISLKKVWWARSNYNINAIVTRGRETLPPTCVLRNNSEGWTLYSWNSYFGKNTGGSQPNVVITTMQMDGADDIRTDFLKIETSNPWYFGFVHRGYVPGLGFGAYDMVANRQVSGTAAVFKKHGNTKALIDAWTLDTTRWMVISQQAPIGWFVYAAEAVPCLMNGKYAVIPTASIDLSKVKASPENSTFYIYVVDTGSGFSYVAKTAPVPETNSQCLIGTVETNATQVNKLVVAKVTRLGTFRLSGSQIGSAIPTVPGNAATTATLDWTIL